MAQKVVGYVKLQIPAGKATPAPPVGPASAGPASGGVVWSADGSHDDIEGETPLWVSISGELGGDRFPRSV